MRKYLIDFALIFMGIAFVAQSHEHQIQVMNQGTASLLDGQRHALLHAGELDANNIQSGFPPAFVEQARLFRAEFLSAMADFNKQQELRDYTSAVQATANFLAWRDSRVGNYWTIAEGKMTPVQVAQLERNLNSALIRVESTNPSKHEVASLGQQFPPNNTNTYGCGPAITCNATYSLALSSNSGYPVESVGSNYLVYSANETYNPIIDGNTTMNCPPTCNQHPTHTPTVSLLYNNGTNYTSNGSGACGNCYFYASGSWTFFQNWYSNTSTPIDISDGGSVVCTIAGTFIRSGQNHWLWENALTLSHTHNMAYSNPTTGTWIYPDQGQSGFDRTSYYNVNIGYYSQDNWCTNNPDADMSAFEVAMPLVYPTGGTLIGTNCGVPNYQGCPVVPLEGLYNVEVSVLWHFPGSTTWLVADNFYALPSVYPDFTWEEELKYWGGLVNTTSLPKVTCTSTSGFTAAKPTNSMNKM